MLAITPANRPSPARSISFGSPCSPASSGCGALHPRGACSARRWRGAAVTPVTVRRGLMPRVVRNGQPRNDLIPSAHVDGNGSVFPQILDLYVLPGSRIADVTFGKGAFWREIAEGRYEVLATDLDMGIDCRDLPYRCRSVDCVVLDPPYMHSLPAARCTRPATRRWSGTGTTARGRAGRSTTRPSSSCTPRRASRRGGCSATAACSS